MSKKNSTSSELLAEFDNTLDAIQSRRSVVKASSERNVLAFLAALRKDYEQSMKRVSNSSESAIWR